MPLFHSTPPPPPPPPKDEPAPRSSFLSALRTPRTPASSTSGLSEYHSAVEPAHDAQSVRSGFFFGRRRSAESLASTTTTSTNATGRSGRSGHSRNSSTPPTSPASMKSPASLKSTNSLKSSKSHNSLLTTTLLRRTPLPNPERDPTVLTARSKIAQAARAEEEADAAIKRAQASVREAMESVKVLEGEAGSESARAKAKNALTKLVSRDARALGKHGE
ncbi:hypothetical protein MSAN_00338100 [Mycena sanguinolenta]|uniref:Uncharacterized protein n=1 Tax=Mycena sanguinolenta TaxID=230812 RepID=A0A8H6Z8L0_9AGAR|nr:hypothetical protein MSAN_00338100 [Mycena sanguinolenta]